MILVYNKVQVSKMKPETLKYLQKDQVGKVIATGLATVYMNKPQKPIKYLAQWLKQYSNNQKEMTKLATKQKQKIVKLKSYQKQSEAKALKQKQKNSKQEEEIRKNNQFMAMINQHEYHNDLLNQILAQHIQGKIHATGVYIGQLNHPPKDITQEDTDQNAHINTAADKVLHYIGSSISHKQLMRGKLLKTTQGVTANAFALLEEAPPTSAAEEEGKEIVQPTKPKYVYIPNVVKNQAIHFFKIPRLGSYIAVPIICNEFLTQSNFDAALKRKLQFIKQSEQLQKSKNEQLEELNKQKQQILKKLAELEQKNADASLIDPIKTELAEIQASITQKHNEKIQQKELQLTSNKKYYVFCADTLGKDRQFTEEDIQVITSLAYHFRDSWEIKQKQLLKHDVKTHIQNLKNLQHPPESSKEQLDKALLLSQEQQKQIAAIADQQKKAYRQLELQLVKFKTVLETNPFYLSSFLDLKKMRIIKYKELIQNLLYFLGYKKSEVNAAKRTTLNWRQVKDKYINQSNFHKIFKYQPTGPKDGQFTFYSKTPYLAEIFDKFQEEQVFKYNIALGAIVIFMKKALELRQHDVEIRKAKTQADKKQRQKILQQNQKVNAKLAEELQKHRSTLSEQDAEIFNQGQWKAQFYTKNPLQQVPAEVEEDHDNDM